MTKTINSKPTLLLKFWAKPSKPHSLIVTQNMRKNHPLFSEEFFADATRTMYWKGFLKRIKYADSLPFDEVGTIIRGRLLPYWETLK